MLCAALEADARAILATRQMPVARIVAVDRDSILYVNACGKARTCWLDLPPGGMLRVQMECGFVAVEPEGWHCGRANHGLAGGRA